LDANEGEQPVENSMAQSLY